MKPHGRFKAVVADIDNTLVNTQQRDYRAFLDTAADWGLAFMDFPSFLEMRLQGASSAQIVAAAFPEMGCSSDREAFQQIRHDRLDRASLMKLDAPFAGVPEALATIHGNGFVVATATLRWSSAQTREELDRLGLGDWIGPVVARDRVEADADRPYDVAYETLVHFKQLVLEHAVAETGCDPGDTIFITDTAFDLEAAAALPVYRVGVRTGYAHEADLALLSDTVLDSFAGLPALLQG